MEADDEVPEQQEQQPVNTTPPDVMECVNYIASRLTLGESNGAMNNNPEDGYSPDEERLRQVLSQREHDLEVAARLGQALLQENQMLRQQAERVTSQASSQIEVLEQDRHGLMTQLQALAAERDTAVQQLQNDVSRLGNQLQERAAVDTRTERGHVEKLRRMQRENERLGEQLQKALAAEAELTTVVRALRSEVEEKKAAILKQQDQMNQLKAQADGTDQARQQLCRDVNLLQENRDELLGCLETAHERIMMLERQHEQQQHELLQQQSHVDELRQSHATLQEQLRRFMVASAAAPTSLEPPANGEHRPSSLFSIDSLETVKYEDVRTEMGEVFHWEVEPSMVPHHGSAPAAPDAPSLSLFEEMGGGLPGPAHPTPSQQLDIPAVMMDSRSPEEDDALYSASGHWEPSRPSHLPLPDEARPAPPSPSSPRPEATAGPSDSRPRGAEGEERGEGGGKIRRRRGSLPGSAKGREARRDVMSMYVPAESSSGAEPDQVDRLAGQVQLKSWQKELESLEADVYRRQLQDSGAAAMADNDWEEIDEGASLYPALQSLADQAETAVQHRMSLLEELQQWQAQTGERNPLNAQPDSSDDDM